jgi:hypothetical protein
MPLDAAAVLAGRSLMLTDEGAGPVVLGVAQPVAPARREDA